MDKKITKEFRELVEKLIDEVLPQVIEWRHFIHSNPELAFHEFETSKFVQEKLQEFEIPYENNIAKTGVIGRIEIPHATKRLAFRAELDALPIQELNTFEHRSKIPHRMHACGHDGHLAGLLGAAKVIKEVSKFYKLNQSIYFIFQPAEENEGGAKKMFEEGLKEKYHFDEVYSIHNWPEMKEGIFGIRSGSIMASYDSFDLIIKAKGSHAAMPHQGIDVIFLSSLLIQTIYSYLSRWNPVDEKVLSFTSIHAGSTYNVLPDQIEIKGTLRTFQQSTRENILNYINNLLKSWVELYGIDYKFELKEGYPATINSKEKYEKIRAFIEKTFDKSKFVEIEKPSMGSEDFSFFLRNYDGVYIWLGSKKEHSTNPPLHSPEYDFNDNILKDIISFWTYLAYWE
ncbi:MAG: amidohydrolase [Leptospiraceae bacterium]|nr:amidohydrolase [Leptospiraceae bacterium]MDW7976151.1 amidohydrolase [Leptospiraceae bacterium]